MNPSLIVARITAGAEPDVAAIFARSDATELPRLLGVRERVLFTFHGLYFHLVDFDRGAAAAMRVAAQSPGFRTISDELRPHIAAYDPETWRSSRDAMARPFYHWHESDLRPTQGDEARSTRDAVVTR